MTTKELIELVESSPDKEKFEKGLKSLRLVALKLTETNKNRDFFITLSYIEGRYFRIRVYYELKNGEITIKLIEEIDEDQYLSETNDLLHGGSRLLGEADDDEPEVPE